MDEDGDAQRPEPRRLTRTQEGRLITGVCSGLARYTRIDPVVFRVAFALLVLTTGVGILLYIAAFLLMGAPDGGPSRIERMSRRIFDGDTTLALLGATLAAGMVLGLAGNWGSGDALSVIVVFGLALLVARSRGVDLVQLARSMPERIKGRPLSSWTPHRPMPTVYSATDDMVDLGRLGPHAGAAGPARPAAATGPYGPGGSGPAPYGGAPYAGAPSGPGPYATGPRAPGSPASPRRRGSFLSPVVLLLALVTGGLLYAADSGLPHFHGVQIAIAGALAVIALGLVAGAWFGRTHKLVFVGAIMTLALACTSIAGDASVARRTHHETWRPAVATEAEQQHHRIVVGQGVVDLTTVPLAPGQRLQVSAEVMLGVLSVKVPSTARVEVDGHALLGDITVDHQVTSGPGARVRRVLQPERTGKATSPVPATIALYIRSKVGDLEVTRVPA